MEKRKITISITFIYALVNVLAYINWSLLNSYKKIVLFLLPIFFFMIIMKKKGSLPNDMLYCGVIVSIFIVFIGIGDKGIGSILNLAFFFIVIIWFQQYRWKKNELYIILFSCLAVIIAYVFQADNYTSMFYAYYYGYSSIQFINPNTVGLAILFCSILSDVIISSLILKKYKICFTIFVVVISIVSLLRLQCRGALISLVVYVLLTMVVPKRVRTRTVCKIALFISIIVSFVIPNIYLYLYNRNVDVNIIGTKKFYSGREILWEKYFTFIKENPIMLIVGIGSKSNVLGLDGLDMHNNSLAMIANYGLLIAVIVYVFMFKINNRNINMKMNDSVYKCSIGLTALIISSFTEATIYFSPSFFFYALLLGLERNIIIHYTDKERRNNNYEKSCDNDMVST